MTNRSRTALNPSQTPTLTPLSWGEMPPPTSRT
jgi:hypothetical protein